MREIEFHGWQRPSNQDCYIGQFTWYHLADSALTGEPLTFSYYANAVVQGVDLMKAGESSDRPGPLMQAKMDDAKQLLEWFREEARQGWGYLPGSTREGTIGQAVLDWLETEGQKPLFDVIKDANTRWEQQWDRMQHLGSPGLDPKGWKVPIVRQP